MLELTLLRAAWNAMRADATAIVAFRSAALEVAMHLAGSSWPKVARAELAASRGIREYVDAVLLRWQNRGWQHVLPAACRRIAPHVVGGR